MPLTLIGTGVSFDLTLSAVQELERCDNIYIETYTNVIEDEKIRSLEKLVKKKITVLERKDVESDFLIEQAKTKHIALISSGDPLTATTHIALLLEAKSKGIDTRVIHNSSIYTAAAGKCGLQIYKFGKSATISTPRANYKPTSWFDIIKENITRGAHTLILLDTEPEPMDAKKAFELIEEVDRERTVKKLVVLSRVGEKDEKISYGDIETLKKHDVGKPPFALIIPGKLHHLEEEYLEFFRV
jgi:diphthine synthase